MLTRRADPSRMAKMKAIQVSTANGPFELVERDIPTPGPHWVRIKIEACGVCHSDVFVKSGGYPGLQLPRIPGHELAGKIDAVGPNVTAWKIGDRVGVGWHGGHCFECDACRRGHFLACEQGKVTGISHDGGYAEYAVVPAESVARIPVGLSAVDAGPLLCAGVTVYNSMRHSGARAGQTVAIQGIGGLGHLAIQYANKMGFRVIALSRGADKAMLAKELGAHEYVDTDATPAAEGLKQLGGADLVVAVAPSSDAMQSAIDGLTAHGKLLILAAPFTPLSVNAMGLLSGKTIAGWPSGTSIDSEDTMKFSVLTGVRPRVETFKLDQAEVAFAAMMTNKVRFRAVLVP